MASVEERMAQPQHDGPGEPLTRRPGPLPAPVAWNGGDSGLEHDPPGPPGPGWYPDPEDADRERWWTGAAWTAHSHTAATNGWFGRAHSRSFWAGPNRSARAARVLALVAAGAWIGAVAVPLGFWVAQHDPGPVLSVCILALLVVSLLAALTGVVVGIRAVRVAERLGGRGLGVRSIVWVGVSAVVAAGLLIIAVVALVSPA